MAEGADKYVLRKFTEADYDLYSSWFDTPPKMKDLPNVGLVSGNMLAVGFLYITDSNFSVMAFWHCNPNNKMNESYLALKEIVKGACDASKVLKRNNVFIYTNQRSMIRLCKSLGFSNFDGHLIKEF